MECEELDASMLGLGPRDADMPPGQDLSGDSAGIWHHREFEGVELHPSSIKVVDRSESIFIEPISVPTSDLVRIGVGCDAVSRLKCYSCSSSTVPRFFKYFQVVRLTHMELRRRRCALRR